MPIETKVESHHKLAFQNSYELATQQLRSKLRPFVTERPASGEAQVATDIIGEISYRRDTGRVRSNFENVPVNTRRWLVWRPNIASMQYIDREDKMRQIDDPSSDLVQAHAMAIRRGIDDIILGIDETGAIDQGGLLGPVTEGKRPTGKASLPADNVTPHGGAGLTVAKLRGARLRLGLDENDLSMYRPCMAITPRQHDDLLAIVEGGTANYNLMEQPQLREGRVTGFMGFDFVEINRLPKSSTTRSCPVWIKERVILGVWMDETTDMWNDTAARNQPVTSVEANMDATRSQDAGVHIIECTES